MQKKRGGGEQRAISLYLTRNLHAEVKDRIPRRVKSRWSCLNGRLAPPRGEALHVVFVLPRVQTSACLFPSGLTGVSVSERVVFVWIFVLPTKVFVQLHSNQTTPSQSGENGEV